MVQSPRQLFNPCLLGKNEQIPAKIWELLRRNTAFRVDVQRLKELDTIERENHAKTGELHGPAWHESWELVENVSERHPFAGVALQWLVPEPLFIVQRVTLPLGKKWKERRGVSPRLLSVGEGTTPDIKDKEHWRWWKSTGQANHAGRLSTRGPDVHWTTSESNRLCDKVNPLQEWQRFHWPFTVENSWKEAPKQLRRKFEHIWRSQFDSRPVNPISKSRSDSPHPRETDFFQGWRLAAFHANGSDKPFPCRFWLHAPQVQAPCCRSSGANKAPSVQTGSETGPNPPCAQMRYGPILFLKTGRLE